MVLPCVVIIPTQDNKLTDQKRRWMKPYSTNALHGKKWSVKLKSSTTVESEGESS